MLDLLFYNKTKKLFQIVSTTTTDWVVSMFNVVLILPLWLDIQVITLESNYAMHWSLTWISISKTNSHGYTYMEKLLQLKQELCVT